MTNEPKLTDIAPILDRLVGGSILSEEDTIALFESMMTGRVDERQIASVLTSMAMRGPAIDEVVGAARIMRQHVTAVPTSLSGSSMLDTAGTGGAPKTFNVSTAAAIVAASAGIRVAKHGNRSRTGRGSAEVLAALGVDIEAPIETQAACLEQAGVCFCFAIHHHPATRFVMPVRRALRFPTIFNLLGPLTNPVGAHLQVLGVWDHRYGRLLAEALNRLGSDAAVVAHSDDGLDEISISAPTTLWWVSASGIEEQRICPEDVGLHTAPMASVTAESLEHAAEMIRRILEGEDHGPPREMVLINAAAALVVGGISETMEDGVTAAATAIDSGEAAQRLSMLAEISRRRLC